MANETILTKSLGHLSSTLPPFLIKLVIAVIILLVGFIIGRIVGKLIYRVLHEFELNKVLEKAGIKVNLEDAIKHFVTYLIYFIAIIWALSELGLSTLVLNIIFAAVIVVIIVAILLGIKDFIPNAFAGFSITKKGIIREGDRIKINGLEGKVKKINLAETEVETKSKDIIIVPNSNLKKQSVLVRKSKRKSR
jgi:small conductance mechanosensitive channel